MSRRSRLRSTACLKSDLGAQTSTLGGWHPSVCRKVTRSGKAVNRCPSLKREAMRSCPHRCSDFGNKLLTGLCIGRGLFFLRLFSEEAVDGSCDRRALGRGCGDLQFPSFGLDGFGSGCSEASHDPVALLILEIGEILFERADSGRREEDIHIVVGEFVVGIGHCLRAIADHGLDLNAMLGEHVDNVVVVHIGASEQVALIGSAVHGWDNILELVVRSEEDPAFAELYVFLQVVSHGLGDAIVVHGLGNLYAQFSHESEEMVDAGSGVEEDCGILERMNTLVAELARVDTDDAYELFEVELYAVMLGHDCIGISLGSRLWL